MTHEEISLRTKTALTELSANLFETVISTEKPFTIISKIITLS